MQNSKIGLIAVCGVIGVLAVLGLIKVIGIVRCTRDRGQGKPRRIRDNIDDTMQSDIVE